MNNIKDWEIEDKLILLEGWARDGLTEEQIANNMGICVKTLYNWKKKSLLILQALKNGKEVVDYEVENALLKRALGYTITIEEEKLDKDGCVHKLKKDVHIPGDTIAQIFWLKNRKKDQWRDKVEVTQDIENSNGVLNNLIEALNNAKHK